jgi:hypothetical protein
MATQRLRAFSLSEIVLTLHSIDCSFVVITEESN